MSPKSVKWIRSGLLVAAGAAYVALCLTAIGTNAQLQLDARELAAPDTSELRDHARLPTDAASLESSLIRS